MELAIKILQPNEKSGPTIIIFNNDPVTVEALTVLFLIPLTILFLPFMSPCLQPNKKLLQ